MSQINAYFPAVQLSSVQFSSVQGTAESTAVATTWGRRLWGGGRIPIHQIHQTKDQGGTGPTKNLPIDPTFKSQG